MSDSPQMPQVQTTEEKENPALPVVLDFYVSPGQLLETVTVDLPVPLPEGDWSFITLNVGGRFIHVSRQHIGM